MRARCAIAVVAAGLASAAFREASADGDAGRGEAVFQTRCAVCHALAPEYHKEGPSLHGVYGRAAGRAPFFPRYRGLKGADFVWTEDALDRFLADPRAFLGGRDTKMTLKLEDARARADVIAFLRTVR